MTTQASKSKRYTGKTSFPLNHDEIAGLRASLLWTYRALGTGVALLEMSDEEFMEAVNDDTCFARFCQILKMVSLDSQYAESQARIRELIIGRMRYAVIERQHPDSKYLINSPIDFSLLPDAPEISANALNGIRPD